MSSDLAVGLILLKGKGYSEPHLRSEAGRSNTASQNVFSPVACAPALRALPEAELPVGSEP